MIAELPYNVREARLKPESLISALRTSSHSLIIPALDCTCFSQHQKAPLAVATTPLLTAHSAPFSTVSSPLTVAQNLVSPKRL